MLQDIYLANYTEAPSGGGAGTIESPYCAFVIGDSEADNAALFDAKINGVASNQTIRLLPGTYVTTGHSGDGSYAGWTPKNGQRIVGSGLGTTTLKLVLVPNNTTRYAIGTNFAGVELSAFELSDLTIDCNLAGTGGTSTTVGALRLRGTHIYIRRVRVLGYGRKNSGSLAVLTAAGDASENCVVDECVMEPPASGNQGDLLLFRFEGTAALPHRFCTVRNCAARGLATLDPPPAITNNLVRALAPGVGIGTVLEGNQIVNCGTGVHLLDEPTKDLVIWNNCFRNVWSGVRLENNLAANIPPGPEDEAKKVGRVTMIDNIIELASASGTLSDCRGIHLLTNQSIVRFKQVLARKNTIQDAQVPLGSNANLMGISLKQCGEVIVENNVLGNIQPDKAVAFEACPAAKFFNNQTPGGELLRANENPNGSAKYRLELADEVQDVLLPV